MARIDPEVFQMIGAMALDRELRYSIYKQPYLTDDLLTDLLHLSLRSADLSSHGTGTSRWVYDFLVELGIL